MFFTKCCFGELNQGRGDVHMRHALQGYEINTNYQSQNLKTETTRDLGT
jgi:hypothetical protein